MTMGIPPTSRRFARCGRWRVVLSTLSSAIFGLLAACRPATPAALGTTRTDSAGVEIVVSSGVDVSLDFPDPAGQSLLGQDGTPYIFGMSTPQWVRTTAAGDVLVLDTDLRAVVRFDSAGRQSGTIGGRGEGPGEFRRPLSLMLNADTISVYDPLKRAILRWTGNGETLIAQQTLDTTVAVGTPYARRGGSVLFEIDVEIDGQRHGALSWSTDSTPLLSFPFPPTTMISLGCRDRPIERAQLFSPRFHVATDGSSVVAAGTAEYQIWIISDSGIVRSIRRDVPTRAPTRAEVRIQAGRGYSSTINGRKCSLSAAELIERSGVAAVFPAVHGLAITADGHTWVMRSFQRESRGTVDEFDSTGVYLRTWRDAPLPLGMMPDGRVIVPRDDQDSGGTLLQVVRLPER